MTSSFEPGSAAAPPTVDTSLPAPPPMHPWVNHCRTALFFTGACYVVLGLAFVPIFAVVSEGDLAFSLAMGTFAFFFSVGFGVLNFVAARGLKQGARWAWILSLVLAAMYVSSACLPIGIVLLVGLLRTDVRQAFLD